MPFVGVSNLHYARNTQDDKAGIAYQAPVPFENVRTININPNVKSKTLFADNGPAFTASVLGEIEVEIEVADLTLAERAVLLGKIVVGGVLTDYSTDSPPYLALGFEALKENGHKEYVWLFKGKASIPEDKYQTQEDDVNFQTKTIKLTFLKRVFDNAWRKIADEDHPDYTADIGANWFTAVQGAAPEALTITLNPLDAAAAVAVGTNMTWTFNNAIQSSDVTDANFYVLNATDGTLIAGALSIDAAHKVVTFDPTANLTAATAYIMVCSKNVHDVYGQTLAATSIGNFTTA